MDRLSLNNGFGNNFTFCGIQSIELPVLNILLQRITQIIYIPCLIRNAEKE